MSDTPTTLGPAFSGWEGVTEQTSRADHAVMRATGLSRSVVMSLFAAGLVKLEGRTIKKGVIVTAGANLRVVAPEVAIGSQLELVVRFADEHFVVVDKAAGVHTYPLRPWETGTLASAVVARFPECATASAQVLEGGVTHRLDLHTSGVVLFARNPDAWQAARRCFTQHAMQKQYLALVEGAAYATQCDVGIEQRGDHVVASEVDNASTEITVVRRDATRALVRCVTHTGMRHQIRFHLAHVGHPIVGDVRYGAAPHEGPPQLFLHAESLTLPALPELGRPRAETFTALLPAAWPLQA